MKPVIKVYAGLSAERGTVCSVLPDADYARPVQRGDIVKDIRKGVTSILILDGVFHQDLAVSPSEIMDALRRGIRVFGASSMGALRAAELESYGMRGVGEIFEYIREAGEFRDDFLGQVFMDGFPQIQEASVTHIEFDINLRKLLGQRRITRETYRRLSTLYADLHYAERNFATLASRIRAEGRNTEALLNAAKRALSTMKRPKPSDARKALHLVSRFHHRVADLNGTLRHPLKPEASWPVVPRGSIDARPGRPPELAAPYPAAELMHGLQRSEPVEYRQNGNRAAPPQTVLKRLDDLMSLVGATRMAEISQLATHGMPVYQSTRPVPFGHTNAGTTTGSQGKGPTPDQAKISCLAETVEGYCLEPRAVSLIRGSYGFLRNHHAVADPRQFRPAIGMRPARVHEPLMWTQALCIEQSSTILVPAELVFYDFFAADYATRALFPCSTNGAGAGSTYLEAATHALYECIEGHYEAAIENGTVRPVRLHHPLEKKWERSEIDVRLYSVMLPGIRNLPFIYCIAETANISCAGSGCFSDLDTTVMRAISEALQTISTSHSGSREDLDEDEDDGESDWDPEDYSPRNMSAAEYRSRIASRRFNDLRTEFRFLMRWLHESGFPVTYMANLTRRGIEFPVVKAIVPGMQAESSTLITSSYSSRDANRHCYGVN
jgi:YcaO-like protein with predicted kinase domain